MILLQNHVFYFAILNVFFIVFLYFYNNKHYPNKEVLCRLKVCNIYTSKLIICSPESMQDQKYCFIKLKMIDSPKGMQDQ